MSAGASKRSIIAIYLTYALILLFFALPLLWLLSLAVRTQAEIFVAEVRIIPRFPTLRNFQVVLQNPQFLVYLWNGLKLSMRRRRTSTRSRRAARRRASAASFSTTRPS